MRKAMLLCGAMACVGIAGEGSAAFATAQSQERGQVPASDQRLPDAETEAQPAPPLPKPVGITRPLKAQGNPGNWVPASAYPRIITPKGIEGTVAFTLYVGTDGRPTKCEVTSSSGWQDLDEASCSNLMKNAKFEPALENGQPVPATYSNRVRWEIAREPPTQPPQPPTERPTL